MDVLLLGCSVSRTRNVRFDSDPPDFSGDNLTCIDMDPNCGADIVMDLSGLPMGEKLPFSDNTFDEVHAYDILEHIGTQGDWKGFFTEFGEYHRVLKDKGRFYILVPIGEDAFTDPGHSRFFSKSVFGFLNQEFYANGVGTSRITDYRWFWKKNFNILYLAEKENHHVAAILEKV